MDVFPCEKTLAGVEARDQTSSGEQLWCDFWSSKPFVFYITRQLKKKALGKTLHTHTHTHALYLDTFGDPRLLLAFKRSLASCIPRVIRSLWRPYENVFFSGLNVFSFPPPLLMNWIRKSLMGGFFFSSPPHPL